MSAFGNRNRREYQSHLKVLVGDCESCSAPLFSVPMKAGSLERIGSLHGRSDSRETQPAPKTMSHTAISICIFIALSLSPLVVNEILSFASRYVNAGGDGFWR